MTPAAKAAALLMLACGAGSATAAICPGGPYSFPIPDGAQAVHLDNALPLDEFNHFGALDANVEGALWRGGSVFVSEFGEGTQPPPSRILQITGNQPGVVFAADAGTNGLATDAAGVLYGASHKIGGIVRFDLPGQEPTVLVGSYRGARFNSPNDLTFRSDGTVYFTDPTWQAPQPAPQKRTRVYRVEPGSGSAKVVDDQRDQPNGITLSPDEQTLYVSARDGLYRYAVAPDGSAGPAVHFATQIRDGDGMVVDCAGNLYVTSTDVVVLDPAGLEIGRIVMPVGAGQITNVAFGGPKRKTLYITAMGSGQARGVFKVKLAVPGLPY